MIDLVIAGGRPWGSAEPVDLYVRDGVFVSAPPPAATLIDLDGCLLLPGLIDAHTHLDKTLFGGPWTPHTAGDALAERIANERAQRGLPNVDNIAALLERMARAGTTHVRSHTDVFPEMGLRGVAAVREAAARLDGRITVEQVAFPQYGVLAEPGTAELLEAALVDGVGTIGGIDPAGMDRDPVRQLDVLFGLAERYGAGVDIHLHDPGTLGIFQIELIAERAAHLAGPVAISHAYALGQADPATQDRVAAKLASSQVSIVTAAVYDFPVAPVKRLRAAGVTVACGHDGIRDLWSPYGSGDMLERAMHLAYRSTFRRDDDIELALHAATHGGARLLRLPTYGLVPGAPADLVAVRVSSAAEAVVTRPARELVLKAGRAQN